MFYVFTITYYLVQPNVNELIYTNRFISQLCVAHPTECACIWKIFPLFDIVLYEIPNMYE